MGSSRPQVAIAACRAFEGADATDVYPDPDWPLLSPALAVAGADATAISWDCEDLDWERSRTIGAWAQVVQRVRRGTRSYLGCPIVFPVPGKPRTDHHHSHDAVIPVCWVSHSSFFLSRIDKV